MLKKTSPQLSSAHVPCISCSHTQGGQRSGVVKRKGGKQKDDNAADEPRDEDDKHHECSDGVEGVVDEQKRHQHITAHPKRKHHTHGQSVGLPKGAGLELGRWRDAALMTEITLEGRL